MSFYLDTSVIVAVVLNEAAAEPVRGWFSRSTQRMIIADLAALEFSAVISRTVRTLRFDESQAALALTNFDMLRSACEPLSHGPADFALAEQLARDFVTKLAAPDALHLATAMKVGATLATFDQRLGDAARAKGFDAFAPPEE